MIRTLTLPLSALLVVAAPQLALAAGGGFSFEVEGYYIIDFAIFVFAMWYFLKGPARKFLVDRHERIKNEMAQATNLKAEAMAEFTEYEKLMAGLDGDIEKIRAEFQADGERERTRILTEGGDAIEKMQHNADRQLAQETAQLRADLEAELVAKVLAAAEAKVKAKLTSASQRKLFDSYIANLETLEDLDQFAA